jgi:hypothetical protein
LKCADDDRFVIGAKIIRLFAALKALRTGVVRA